jgi:exoribonuclease R
VVHRRLRAPADVALDFEAIRRELEVPGDFPAPVEAEAAALAPDLSDHVDATDLPLVTIDPEGSRDLDQAVAIEARPGGGWVVHYAIADVAAWVRPGDAIDTEARARTQTYYAPDRRRPLHPTALGEGRASLLPDGDRPAALWRLEVDADGEPGKVEVRRAMVRSRAQLAYPGVQADLDAGRANPAIAELPALGAALLAAARRRGAIDLDLPEQEVVPAAGAGWTVVRRADLPVEAWNAQVSLLTGRAAAGLMLGAGIGLLRTVPTPPPEAIARLRTSASSLGITWPEGTDPGSVLASLDPADPRHAAFAELAAELLRGSGYTAFAGTPPAEPGHAGVGAPYAHVTAPLRRLADRFATEVCLAVAAGREVPAWAAEALPALPEAMEAGDHRAHALERAVVDATEAFVLADRVGAVFPADVVESGDRYGTVVLDEPPVRGRCDTRHLPLGEVVHVRCTVADVAARTVRFERVS